MLKLAAPAVIVTAAAPSAIVIVMAHRPKIAWLQHNQQLLSDASLAAAAAAKAGCHAPAGFSRFAALAALLGLEPLGKKFLKPAGK
jgi:hypothetical protein